MKVDVKKKKVGHFDTNNKKKRSNVVFMGFI